MTTYYVDSNGSNTSPYDTWAKGAADLATIAAIDAAGDIIYVAHNHSESTAAPVSWSWAGTAASPTRIICANSGSGEPPSTLATTGAVATTGTAKLTIANTGVVYIYGLVFSVGTGAGDSDCAIVNNSSGKATLESCDIQIVSTNAGSNINFCETAGEVTLINCNLSFGNTLQNVGGVNNNVVTIIGGSIKAGSAAITTFIDNSLGNGSRYEISGFDFSNAATGLAIVGDSFSTQSLFVMRNCKLPSSWSGSLASSVVAGTKAIMHNSDASDTNYRAAMTTEWGSIVSETTLVRTGGASDGTTTISRKMTSNANTEWNHQTLDSTEIVQWNETVGSSITATIEILHDSATALTDKEVWVDVQYLGTSGFPLSLFIDDAAADYVASAANQTSSSATWTTTGMSNPNKQKLEVTFTPQEKGFIHAVVRLAKASYTIYVDPLLTVS